MTGISGNLFSCSLFWFTSSIASHSHLWINLVTDGLPGLALASEPAEGSVMNRTKSNAKYFLRERWHYILEVLVC
jgi:Ca2+-transporting ATPase